jgi:hypothetical protein
MPLLLKAGGFPVAALKEGSGTRSQGRCLLPGLVVVYWQAEAAAAGVQAA